MLHAHRRFESSENPTTYVVFAASRLRDPEKPMAFWGEEEQYYRRIFASQNGAHIYLLRRYDRFESLEEPNKKTILADGLFAW